MSISVTRQDPRYPALRKGNNIRFPATDADAAARIEICESVGDLAAALQRAVDAGQRPTVRSGGHCYENFVANNPGGVILDVSFMNAVSRDASGVYSIGPGAHLGDIYLNLYKKYGVTIPGGTCYGVGAGGHISGGGYGMLSRLHGLTVDWLSAVDILTVNAQGKVEHLSVDRSHDPDLFRACRGAGGGNFGIVTEFRFDKLPQAPEAVMEAHLRFPWADMTEDRFVAILTALGEYFEKRGQDPDTFGLFVVGYLGQRGPNAQVTLSARYCNLDGTCCSTGILEEFLARFNHCGPSGDLSAPPQAAASGSIPRHQDAAQLCAVPQFSRRLWLDATLDDGGGVGGGVRAKYKSTYMKRGFSVAEARCFYKHLTREAHGTNVRGSVVEFTSYGGAINQQHLIAETASAQRSSAMKLQFQTYWVNEADDAAHLQWIRDFYTELYSGPDADPQHLGAPYPGGRYEGCYINYADSDMLAYDFWPQLYYGDRGLYPFLQEVKRRYDPNNIFHHALSIRP